MRTAIAEHGDYEWSISVAGNAVARFNLTLCTQVSGDVFLEVKKGDAVNIGNILARVNNPELICQLDREHAPLQLLEVEFDTLNNQIKQKGLSDLYKPRTIWLVTGYAADGWLELSHYECHGLRSVQLASHRDLSDLYVFAEFRCGDSTHLSSNIDISGGCDQDSLMLVGSANDVGTASHLRLTSQSFCLYLLGWPLHSGSGCR